MNKLLQGAVVIAALIGLAASPSQIYADDSFKDLTGVQEKEKIESLHARGLVQGMTGDEFRPQAALTASQGVTMIVKSLKLNLDGIAFIKKPEAKDVFTRVANDAWYAQPFIVAHYNELDIPASIEPGRTLTREEFIHYLVQGIERTGAYPLPKIYIQIKDEASITPSYQGTIERALVYKVTALDPEGNIHPKDPISRAEAAAMIYEAVAFVESHEQVKSQP
ncbi:S-layer homology domain-containing protein [Paenibacillus sp. VMFN-D1]|uniref:S-layer homology domain-containing protein n=1 Tax=Paenibacillus sp. VMFN-D1 TaxID=2135608 RepID=UPI000E3A7851|nr:S-layer homology domain-containing protein [Paenibacillus sp. VMFN-D1]RED41323.1 S-layer family protein [Paenibacillus sp. VMFN-D1]